MSDLAISALLERTRAGDADAFDRLVGQLYGELHALARAQRRRLHAPDTVSTTAVVHEAYAKLSGRAGGPLAYADGPHFFRVAARVMRDVIVDYARARRTAKRGGDSRLVPLDEAADEPFSPGALDPDEVLSLDGALDALERFDAEAARVVELRYFAGLSIEETAEALALSPSTVKRRWTLARAWLYTRLADGPPGDESARRDA